MIKSGPEGKIEQLIRAKAFLKGSVKDYSAGRNDVLDYLVAMLDEAKEKSHIVWSLQVV